MKEIEGKPFREPKNNSNSSGERPAFVEQHKTTGSPERGQPLKDLPKKDAPRQDRHIEITGPVKMEPGQNFYDQFPFQGVIAKVSEHTGIDQSDLRFLLTKYAKAVEDADITETKENERTKINNKIINDLRTWYPKSPDRAINTTENLRIALNGICNTLDKAGLPDWRSYISAKHTFGNYRLNGEYYSKGKQPVSESTYMAWAEENAKRDRRIMEKSRIVAVHDAFPQQTKKESITEAIPEIGERRNARTWRIIRGMEI